MSSDTSRAAGRPREFDPSKKAEQALKLFCELGYRATTTRHLEATLEVNQASLYRAFGTKEKLLDAALNAYDAFTESLLLEPLRNGSGGLADISAYFDRLQSGIGRGCLLVALMGELGNENAEVAKRNANYRASMRSAFRAALDRSVLLGELPSQTVGSRTEVLMVIVLGVNIGARGGASQEELTLMLDSAREELIHWHVA